MGHWRVHRARERLEMLVSSTVGEDHNNFRVVSFGQYLWINQRKGSSVRLI
jgi:hypothetical protein